MASDLLEDRCPYIMALARLMHDWPVRKPNGWQELAHFGKVVDGASGEPRIACHPVILSNFLRCSPTRTAYTAQNQKVKNEFMVYIIVCFKFIW